MTQEKLNTDFLQAARGGNLAVLKDLWLNGAEVNTVEKAGDLPLATAAYNGHTDCVRFLLEMGARVDLRNSVSCTPLMCAASQGHLEAVRLLLEAGADPALEAPERDNKTALSWAVEGKHGAVTNLLKDAIRRDVPLRQAPPRIFPPRLDGDDVIFSRGMTNRTLQHVFNFRAQEKITLIRNGMTGPVEAMVREDFARVDPFEVEEAFRAYQELGGKIPATSALPDRLDKARVLPKRAAP